MTKTKKILNNKWVRWGIIPFALFALWLIMSFLYFQSTFGFTTLTNNFSSTNFTKYSNTELLQGDKVQGEFKASYDNLGIVLVRFNTFYKISNDFVIFRIKELGQENWYYENKYKVDQFQPDELFTFGFPVIPNSSEKSYVFEIESTMGMAGDAVALSKIEPVFVTKYQYPKTEIASNPEKAFSFATLKTINSLTSIEFVTTTAVYLLPFLLYMLYVLFFNKYFIKKYIFALLPIGFLALQSIFGNNSNDLVIIILTIISALTFAVYRLESSITFALALIFLVIPPILFLVGNGKIAENFAVWSYMLMLIGTTQAVWEIKSKNKNLISLAGFIRKIRRN